MTAPMMRSARPRRQALDGRFHVQGLAVDAKRYHRVMDGPPRSPRPPPSWRQALRNPDVWGCLLFFPAAMLFTSTLAGLSLLAEAAGLPPDLTVMALCVVAVAIWIQGDLRRKRADREAAEAAWKAWRERAPERVRRGMEKMEKQRWERGE